MFIGYDPSSKGYKLYNPSIEKVIISRDVEFDKKGLWDWSTQKEKYDFFPLSEEEERRNEVHEGPVTPPPSPIASSSSSLLEGSFCERPKKMRSLQDIYDSTEVIDNVTLFFCLLIVKL